VWFVAEQHDGLLEFRAVSDAAIVSGLIAMLLRIYSGRRPQDILDTPPNFVTALELEQHLSPTRSNGLSSMLKAIRTFATEALQAD
jgi:cysteine desulfuration protein SufE